MYCGDGRENLHSLAKKICTKYFHIFESLLTAVKPQQQSGAVSVWEAGEESAASYGATSQPAEE